MRGAPHTPSEQSCKRRNTSRSRWSPLLSGYRNRHAGAEERHTSDEIDAAVDEAGGQRRLQVREAIARVVDDASAVQERVHEARARTNVHAVADERVAEDSGAACD